MLPIGRQDTNSLHWDEEVRSALLRFCSRQMAYLGVAAIVAAVL